MAEMRDVELFRMALGLESPWYVERTEFDAEGQRLDLYLDFREGGRFTARRTTRRPRHGVI
jgi:hypothetical protein